MLTVLFLHPFFSSFHKPNSIEQSSNLDEKLDEFPLSYILKIIDISETDSYKSILRSPDLKTINKNNHQEICISIMNPKDFPEHSRLAFNISLYNTDNHILYKTTKTFSSGTWTKNALWECGNEFVNLPVGFYKVEVNFAGNIQHAFYRVVD